MHPATNRKVNVASTPAKKPTTKKASTKKATTSGRAPRKSAPTHDAISKRAYELSQEDGGRDSVDHWLQAERELKGS
jgi:hypothetical protein